MRSLLTTFSTAFIALSLAACGNGQDSNATAAATQQTTTTGDTSMQTPKPATPTSPDSPSNSSGQTGTTNDNVSQPPKDGDEVAVLDTAQGQIVIKFLPDKAPNHVANFKKLANSHFYDGTKFHRIIPNFMIQGGDPNSKSDDRMKWGTGGPGWSVNQEFNDISHVRGIVSMARTSDPNSAGSQFFIVVKDSPFLDNQYTVFGYVVKGMDVVDKIRNLRTQQPGDQPEDGKAATVKSVKIEKWPVK